MLAAVTLGFYASNAVVIGPSQGRKLGSSSELQRRVCPSRPCQTMSARSSAFILSPSSNYSSPATQQSTSVWSTLITLEAPTLHGFGPSSPTLHTLHTLPHCDNQPQTPFRHRDDRLREPQGPRPQEVAPRTRPSTVGQQGRPHRAPAGQRQE